MRYLVCLSLWMWIGCGNAAETTGGAREQTASSTSPEEPSNDGAFVALEGFLPSTEVDAILDRSAELVLSADASGLRPGETRVLAALQQVGDIFHRLYEESRHPQAARVRQHLMRFVPQTPEQEAHLLGLRTLYALFRGPIAVNLENARVGLGPVSDPTPGRNLYPAEVSADTLSAFASEHPDAGILDVRTVVRARTQGNLDRDRAVLGRHPALTLLHPEVSERLEEGPAEGAFYGVPYSVAYAEEMLEAYRLLRGAARDVRAEDVALADYLEQRARDLLSNDYEAGDAVWVSSETERLNAEIGAYETYDDRLLGVKAFFALSILVRDPEGSSELASAIARLAEFERALPGGPYGGVRARIPVGIYDVYADFGQARGGNTASILPNEAHITRRYGRTILIRRNVLTNPEVLSLAQRRFRAAVTPANANDLGARGNFDRTVWHEVGHYLGPKETEGGRPIPEALGNLQNHFEEMKADLVSLWLMPRLADAGILDANRVRSAYAAGVLRTLQPVEPRRDSPYRTMQLMQQNFFLEHGALSFNHDTGRLDIHYERYADAVAEMLSEVLGIQRAGDRTAAEAFIERWARWDPAVQGRMAPAIDAAAPRYRRVRYPALGDPWTQRTGAE